MKKAKSTKDELVTKDYLDQKLSAQFDAFKKYLDFRLEPFEDMRKKYDSTTDQIMRSIDWLVGAFKKFDEEHTILASNQIEATN